jgi:hypothetical protein
VRANNRSWTDEVFNLFIEGRFGSLSARDVCRAIDRIADQRTAIERLGVARGEERRTQLVTLVEKACRVAAPHRGEPVAMAQRAERSKRRPA